MAKKDDKKKDSKKAKGSKKDGAANDHSSIATHPRARASVRRTKAWIGLAAFAATAVLSLKANVPAFQTFERALVAGLIGYFVAWFAGIQVWRHLILAEQQLAYEEIQRRRAEDAEAEAAEQAKAGRS